MSQQQPIVRYGQAPLGDDENDRLQRYHGTRGLLRGDDGVGNDSDPQKEKAKAHTNRPSHPSQDDPSQCKRQPQPESSTPSTPSTPDSRSLIVHNSKNQSVTTMIWSFQVVQLLFLPTFATPWF
ncbi:hypothetical protein FPSE_08974 [Fusarium pseudograminearum CS3096]|uniref:Uncharacterized protein n=1 Tax=Fusarium pseudograminearum (strain CS3096) TaxID=1028729 RepID=K3VAR0_FUSPC|nr:hypothetical protein FPSE_08974 [Fusarium pseudograminearum CS3096]EKJ70822.1 hypothetical protein FPSE_08974 [Fusarium pseudograminearum CS3096]